MRTERQRIRTNLAEAVLTIGAALLAACTVGPKYTRPSAPIPPAYKELGASNIGGDWKLAQPADAASRGAWWEGLHDRELNKLEQTLNGSNQNIAAAAANVEAARAAIRQARAQYFPTIAAAPSIAN